MYYNNIELFGMCNVIYIQKIYTFNVKCIYLYKTSFKKVIKLNSSV